MKIYKLYKNGMETNTDFNVESADLEKLSMQVKEKISNCKIDNLDLNDLNKLKEQISKIFNGIIKGISSADVDLKYVEGIRIVGEELKTFEVLEITIMELEIKIAEKEYFDELNKIKKV